MKGKKCAVVHKEKNFSFAFPYQTNANLNVNSAAALGCGRFCCLAGQKEFNAPVPTVKVKLILYCMVYLNAGEGRIVRYIF